MNISGSSLTFVANQGSIHSAEVNESDPHQEIFY
jgi:hypothetical protein